jgi:hypothetical protein
MYLNNLEKSAYHWYTVDKYTMLRKSDRKRKELRHEREQNRV